MIRAIPDPKIYKYVSLISGSDFIIKPIVDIINFFEKSDEEFIDQVPLPCEGFWSWGGEDRYSVWYPQLLIQRPTNKLMKLFRVLYREFVMRTKVFKRKDVPVNKFYGGSSWFTLSGDCINWIRSYLDENKQYIDFFRHGVCVDEVFFSTLVGLSPFSAKVANRNLTYMVWNRSNKTGGPGIITEKDLAEMKESDYIFTRKVMDIEVVNKIVEELVIGE